MTKNVTVTAEEVKALAHGAGALFCIIAMPFTMALKAYTLTVLYGWFAPSLGWPSLSFSAVGVLCTLAAAWSYKPNLYHTDAKNARNLFWVTVEHVGMLLMALGIGYAFHVWGR